jgi:hypothetical protein
MNKGGLLGGILFIGEIKIAVIHAFFNLIYLVFSCVDNLVVNEYGMAVYCNDIFLLVFDSLIYF